MFYRYVSITFLALAFANPCVASEEPQQKKQKIETNDSFWGLLPDNCKLLVLSHLPPDVRAVTRRVCTEFKDRVDYMETSPVWLNQISNAKTFSTRLYAYIKVPANTLKIFKLGIMYKSLGCNCIYTRDRPFVNRETAIISFVHQSVTPLTYDNEITAVVNFTTRVEEYPENDDPSTIQEEAPNGRSLTYTTRLVHSLLHPGKNPEKIVITLALDPGKRAYNGEQQVSALLGSVEYKYPVEGDL